MIESIPGWDQAPELAEVHAGHMWAFKAMRKVKRHPTLDAFGALVKEIARLNKEHVRLMAMATHRLSQDQPDKFSADFVDRFLDNFLSNRIGTNALLLQYTALTGKFGEGHARTGLVDPECDLTAICKIAARKAQQICKEHTGCVPVINVSAHTDVRGTGRGDEETPRMPYIPFLLNYIMLEILKNSCRATIDAAHTADVTSASLPWDFERGKETSLAQKPISVRVCGDDSRVLICVSDHAGGIPFDVGKHVWSYLYTTATKHGNDATELAGWGVGLPIARLYARYLGGSLNLVSLPGFGTHAYIFLPRMLTQQVEVIPVDTGFTHSADGNFVL